MTIPDNLPLAAKKMLQFLDSHYKNNGTPLCAVELAKGAHVSPSHGRMMLPLLREAKLITFVGNAEQAGRKELTKYTALFAPIGVMPLARIVRPLDQRDTKQLPENAALGPRSAMTAEEFREKQRRKPRYKGEKMPMPYVPPFREMTPDDHDIWSHRNLAMLAR
jgi:hypothetical protein